MHTCIIFFNIYLFLIIFYENKKFEKNNKISFNYSTKKILLNKKEIETTKKIKINGSFCNKNNDNISIFIHSSAQINGKYYYRRQLMRNTWVTDAFRYNISVYFVLGTPLNDKIQKKIEEESKKYEDILQFDFQDDYNNNTLKAIATLQWINIYCTNSQYILKTDDDVMINIKQLIKQRKTFKNGISGYIWKNARPIRNDIHNKWFMPKKIYFNNIYPNYANGAAYIMTKNAIKILNKALSKNLKNVLYIDDLYITGILTKKYGISLHHRNDFIYLNNCLKINIPYVYNNIIALTTLKCNNFIKMVTIWKYWKKSIK